MISNASSYLLPMNMTAPAEIISSTPKFSINDLKHNSDIIKSNTLISNSDFDLTTNRNSFLHFLESNGMPNAVQLGATPPKDKEKPRDKARKFKNSSSSGAKGTKDYLQAKRCCEIDASKANEKIKALNADILNAKDNRNNYLAKRNAILSANANKGKVVCRVGNEMMHKFVPSSFAFPYGKVTNVSVATYHCSYRSADAIYSNCYSLKDEHCQNWLSSVDIVNKGTCNEVSNWGQHTSAGYKFADMNCNDYVDETSFKYTYPAEVLLLIGAGLGAGGMLGVASLCGIVYLSYKILGRNQSTRLTNFGTDIEGQINRRAIIDPTKNVKNIRTGVGKKKLIKSKIDNKLPPQPSVGVKKSNEFEELFQYENEKTVFPQDESDLYHYVRPVRPPKYVDHSYKETEIEAALHQAHHKRVEHLKDQIEEAKENCCAAQLTLKQIKREGDNHDLLHSAERILFEEQQKLKSLETKYTEITNSVKNAEKPHEAIHLPPSYETIDIHHGAYRSLESKTKEARDKIIESLIDKNKASVSNFSNGLTINKTVLDQEKILDADIALLSVKEEINEILKNELLEKIKLQLGEKIVLGKSDILKENITATLNNKNNSEQLTQMIFEALPVTGDANLKGRLENNILSVAKDTVETNTDNAIQDKAYIANIRMQKMKDILAHNKSLVIEKQKQLNLLSLDDPNLMIYQEELKQLMIKSEDENLAMKLVKERELKEKEELANTRKILKIGNVKANIINAVSEEVAATITVLPSSEINIEPLALDLELIVDKAMRSRYKQKINQRENIEKLNAFIETTDNEEKRTRAKELLAEAMSLSNEISAQRNITLKFMKERDENSVINEHSLGGAIYNKLYEDKVRRAKKE